MRTTEQRPLSATVQAQRLSLFGDIARLPDETCKEDLNSPPSEELEETTRTPSCMKTIQQDLELFNLFLNEAINFAQNRPLWTLIVYIWRYALIMVHSGNKRTTACLYTRGGGTLCKVLHLLHHCLPVFDKICGMATDFVFLSPE